MKVRRNKGFTPIELLIVIAIIAMLITIVTPAMQKAKRQARNLMCKSNLHQWGLVVSTYSEDYDSRFMDYSGKSSWTETLRGYYDDPKLRLCPSAKKFKNPDMDSSVQNSHIGGAFTSWGRMPEDIIVQGRIVCRKGDYGSYGMSKWASSFTGKIDNPDRDKYWDRMTNVKSRSGVALFVDCNQRVFKAREDDRPPRDRDGVRVSSAKGSGPGQLGRACIDRHDQTVNALFMDLSSRPIGLKE